MSIGHNFLDTTFISVQVKKINITAIAHYFAYVDCRILLSTWCYLAYLWTMFYEREINNGKVFLLPKIDAKILV